MNQNFPIEGAQFFTATIFEWNHLLADDDHKNIIVDCLKFLVSKERIELNAFVIMSNHIHLIWQPLPGFTASAIQASFMKYTAQQLKRSQLKKDEEALSVFKVDKYDREYHPDNYREEKGAFKYRIGFGGSFQTKIRIYTL